MRTVEKKKMGRPTDNPKTIVKRARMSEEDATRLESFRLSEEDMNKIRFCMEKAGMSKTDVIRAGIDAVYEKMNL